MAFLATFEPGEDSPHWFVLDRAILGAARARADGPAARRGVPAAREEEILEALAIGLQWYRDRPEEPRDDAALNAVRTRAYLETGAWRRRRRRSSSCSTRSAAAVESRREAQLRGTATASCAGRGACGQRRSRAGEPGRRSECAAGGTRSKTAGETQADEDAARDVALHRGVGTARAQPVAAVPARSA